MYLSNQSLLVILVVGLVAGWLACRVMEGGGFGLIGDLLVGLIGAFLGDWLLPQLGIHLGAGIIALIINGHAVYSFHPTRSTVVRDGDGRKKHDDDRSAAWPPDRRVQPA
jgi:uncharacterized membrane protein YeaQ/YmgE (transglycosylase-associated protein family)